MSRDRLFEHYQQFVYDNINLRNKAFLVLTAALKLLDEGENADLVFEKMDFGLRVLIITQEQT